MKKVRPNGEIKPIEKGVKETASTNWSKKNENKKNETSKGKFDWLKKLNIFKKPETEKKS